MVWSREMVHQLQLWLQFYFLTEIIEHLQAFKPSLTANTYGPVVSNSYFQHFITNRSHSVEGLKVFQIDHSQVWSNSIRHVFSLIQRWARLLHFFPFRCFKILLIVSVCLSLLNNTVLFFSVTLPDWQWNTFIASPWRVTYQSSANHLSHLMTPPAARRCRACTSSHCVSQPVMLPASFKCERKNIQLFSHTVRDPGCDMALLACRNCSGCSDVI